MKLRDTPNAGGSSLFSEVLSFEVLTFCMGAQLEATEMEIEYVEGSKITDYSITIAGRKIGVSVTRIINFEDLEKKYKTKLRRDEIVRLLYKKLHGINESTKGVYPEYRWERQILHIFVTSRTVKDMVVEEYHKIPQDLRSNTLVVVTVAGNAAWIF